MLYWKNLIQKLTVLFIPVISEIKDMQFLVKTIITQVTGSCITSSSFNHIGIATEDNKALGSSNFKSTLWSHSFRNSSIHLCIFPHYYFSLFNFQFQITDSILFLLLYLIISEMSLNNTPIFKFLQHFVLYKGDNNQGALLWQGLTKFVQLSACVFS